MTAVLGALAPEQSGLAAEERACGEQNRLGDHHEIVGRGVNDAGVFGILRADNRQE
jgi:hypothetical protein